MAKISNITLPDGNSYNIKAVAIPFGNVASSSTATAFTASIDGITELSDGVCAYITNTKITSAANCTLNINSLGAKPIYSTLTNARVTTAFTLNSTMLFVYNSSRVTGGCWDMYYGIDSTDATAASVSNHKLIITTGINNGDGVNY